MKLLFYPMDPNRTFSATCQKLEPGCSLADITSIPVWLAAGIRLMIPRTHEDGNLDCDIRAGSAGAGTSEYSLNHSWIRDQSNHIGTTVRCPDSPDIRANQCSTCGSGFTRGI